MARYKLLSQHYSEEDKLLEVDTIVGDGTPHLWTRPPTVEMEALDDEARHLIDRERRRAGEKIAPLDDLPLTMGEAQARYDEDVEAADAEPEEPEPLPRRMRSPPTPAFAGAGPDRRR